MRAGSASVPDGAVVAGKILDPSAVGRALKPLVARTETLLTQAMVSVSDALATFRVMQLPATATSKDVDAAIARELPFDPQRTATRWVDMGSTPEKRVVYMVAWDKALLANVTDAVKQSGLEPVVVELKSASLARVVPEPSCVVVDLSSQPAELVVIDGYLPQVWHSYAVSDSFGDDAALSMGQALRSMLRFYRRHSDGQFGNGCPVYVSGERTFSSHALTELSHAIDQPVMPLPAPPRVPSNIRHSTYLACLGLLMRRAS